MQLKVRLFGKFELQRNGHHIDTGDWPRYKTQLLFKLMVAERGRVFTQDQLMEALFPDVDPDKAGRNLRARISEVRKLLEPELARGNQSQFILRPAPGAYCFSETVDCWVDVEVFEQHLDAARELEETARFTQAIGSYEQALKLYLGNYLSEDLYEDWTLPLRQHWHERQLDALEGLARCYSHLDQFQKAKDCCQRVIELAPVREQVHQLLMRCHYFNGERQHALQAYQACVGAMKDLGGEPSVETRSLYLQIKKGQLEQPTKVIPNNLPHLATRFIGREASLRLLGDLLDDPANRLLTLVGPGGVGKTRLSIQAATEVLDRFEDGVYFVDLSAVVSSDQLIIALADALRFTFHGTRSPKDQLFGYLSKKHMLLILDNFEQLVEAGAQALAELIEVAPNLTLMATSRERLHLPEEVVFEVKGMAVPSVEDGPEAKRFDVIQLFLERMRHIDPRFGATTTSLPTMIHICRLVEGVPLGVELATAWARVLSLDEIIEEIESSTRLLAEEVEDYPERHRSIKIVFDASWRLMVPEERNVFSELTVFRGGFTREAAHQVAGATVRDLTALLDKSLLYRARRGRYNVHELLRQFGQEKRGPGTESMRRHLDHFLQLATQAEPELQSKEQATWLQRLDDDRDNFEAALSWSFTTNEEEKGAQLAAALARYWELHNRFAEGQRWLTQAVEAPELSAPMRAKAMMWTGVMAKLLGDHASALGYTEQSLLIYRRINDRRGIAWALNNLGGLLQYQGDNEAALAHHTESEAIQKELGHREGRAFSINNLGLTSAALGDYEKALAYFEDCLAMRREMGDDLHAAWICVNLGSVHLQLQNLDQAMRLLEEALATLELLQDKRGIAKALYVIGSIHARRNQPEQAHDFYEQSLSLCREIDEKQGIAISLNHLGELAFRQADLDEARAYFDEALTICVDSQEAVVLPQSLLGLALGVAEQAPSQRVAQLLGGIHTLIESGRCLTSAERQTAFDDSAAALRNALGRSAFDRAWKAGGRLPLERLIELVD